MADDPNEFRDHVPGICEQCGGAFSLDAAMELIGEYDEIEIPPVKPYVIRHRRFACRCAHRGSQAKALAPAIATTTLFGPRNASVLTGLFDEERRPAVRRWVVIADTISPA
ncbi:MAG: IS66 family transposase zinc-finger binding domain-containing protein [Acidiphilium sp.]|nr:IS66 family transposase zinc-finger binding domain-containing protein [Acidiphilium sp.]